MFMTKNRWLMTLVAITIIVTLTVYAGRKPSESESTSVVPTRSVTNASDQQVLSMREVHQLAKQAREHLGNTLNDYTARFVKQVMDDNGVLSPKTEMTIKVQSRFRNDSDDAPMRVYLRFDAPEAYAGREVIWCEDLHDGMMAVHEVGLLFSLKTLWLDPNGVLAMQGERYPINEIGFARLAELMVELSERNLETPGIQTTSTSGHPFDGRKTDLIRIEKDTPSDEPHDFRTAEVVFDPVSRLILSFRSFGWPDQEGAEPPLLEAYAYHDVQLNLGLTDADFETSNPKYNFPSF